MPRERIFSNNHFNKNRKNANCVYVCVTRENILFVRQFSVSCSRIFLGQLLKIYWDSSQLTSETIDHEELWKIYFSDFQNVKTYCLKFLRVSKAREIIFLKAEVFPSDAASYCQQRNTWNEEQKNISAVDILFCPFFLLMKEKRASSLSYVLIN